MDTFRIYLYFLISGNLAEREAVLLNNGTYFNFQLVFNIVLGAVACAAGVWLVWWWLAWCWWLGCLQGCADCARVACYCRL